MTTTPTSQKRRLTPHQQPTTNPALAELEKDVVLHFRNLLRDRRGATAIEYGLIAALISIACIIAFESLGLNLADVFQTIADTLAA